ncbi:hypothetical protein KUV62_15730 [Salipiger bermudensis]|uniref:hypothetical protein n=1 Tax=Salipiger bermudensis TaxID=344736 RepID=UPI001C994BA5|nr:hypothetical protein [Salipiger bermudensis]MBY6005375.1 hypothetical protein [Salipiger bermudensis]
MTYVPPPTNIATSGTIDALNETVELDINNCASGIITVTGTFTGTLTVTGLATSTSTAEGGRLLFQSGVGSIGTNQIVGTGSAVSREYRFVAGGSVAKVEATAWTSGSVDIEIVAHAAPNTVFVIGPVHDAFEEAQRAGRAYSVGTSTQSVTASNYLQARFQNDSTDKRYFLTQRLISNNRASGQTNLELEFFPTYSTALTGGTSVTPNNLKPGAASSAADFEYAVNGTSLGTPALGQILPVDGVQFRIDVNRIIEPGQSFAYQIGGAGGSLSNAARVALTLIWYEEDLQ